MPRRKPRRWLGIDGEGVGRKPHRYVMLGCSDGDFLESRGGIKTVDALRFLLDLSTRDVRLCGYYLSYDWTMILRDLPDSALYRLFRPELRARPKDDGGGFDRVYYKGFGLHYLAGAMWLSDRHRKTVVWDLGKYYQGPFVGALKAWKLAPDVCKHIEAMKKRRALFTWKERKRIREYCLKECVALAELAQHLDDAHTEAGLASKSWHGPGSTASVLLKRERIHERRGMLPPPVMDAAQRAYFGGRAEILCNGRINRPVWEYDISSAYPFHATNLPCLEHGRWERVTNEKVLSRATHAVVRGHIDSVKSDWGPLPIRLPSGSIVFPRQGGSGWWWRDEWLEARKGWKNGLRFELSYVLRCECDCRPFAFIPGLFDLRVSVGKDSGAGKILKLGLNSVYGKLAQAVGGAQYASRAWAGMITSGTRAQVLNLMQRHKRLDSVVMVATDGVYSTECLEVGERVQLGGWERQSFPDGMTLVRPGIYWMGDNKLRARGLGRDSLEDARLLLADALERGDERVILPPRVVFGGAKLTVYAKRDASLQRSTHYGQWHTIPTRVSLAPGPKRDHEWLPPKLSGVDSEPFGARSTAKVGALFETLELLRDLTM